MSDKAVELPCQDKLPFNTKEAAEGAAVLAAHRYGDKPTVYQCRYCNQWHLATPTSGELDED